MPSELSENRIPKLSLPMGKIKVPLFLYLFVIFLGILILVVGFLNVYLNNQKNNSLRVKVSPTPIEPSNLVIAKKTLDWLNQQKDENIKYKVGCECVNSECTECKDSIYVRRNYPFIVWGKFRFFERKDNLDELIKEVDLFQNNIKEDSLQYGGWNCKLLYEAWKSDKLPQSTKDQIKNICVKSEYEFEDDLIMPVNFNNVISDEINKLLNNQKVVYDSKNYNSENLYDYSGLSSEMAIRLLWKPTTSLITFEGFSETDLAKIYFERALGSYVNKKVKDMKDHSMLGISAIDLYKITGNDEYLRLAEYLSEQKTESNRINVYSSLYFVWFIEEMQQITGDLKFGEIAKETMDIIIQNGWKEESKVKALRGPGNFYLIHENSLFVGLLSSIK